MKPGRDAELVPGPFIDIWIVGIIVSDVDGSIFTLVFLVVTIIETAHISSTILVDIQLIIVFLVGSLEALNIFVQSKNRTPKVPEGLYCRRQT